ncbi:MAG: carboxypeptidase regulatory-like domain-containing protein [Acidobacteriota bacterium]
MKRCPNLSFRAVIIAATCIALFAVSGFAQFQTGNIYGKVQGKDGSVLPGVTVVLTGMGAPATTVTDAQGNFRFVNLSPGTYTLKAELAGYGTATRAGLGVRISQSSDVTMTLNPSVSESITVTAEAPLLDIRKAGTGANVPRVELEKIPTSRDPWTILQQAPSVQVDRLNVGGNESGQQSVYLAKGAGGRENTWNVDGVNITDMGAVGASPMYFDFDSFEEMQVTTGGSDPRVQTPGVQLNMVTKRGTNDFKGSGRYFYTPGSQQADATVPGEATSYLDLTNRINYVRDYGAELGGPIWRDHLWGWVAVAKNSISTQTAQAPGAVGAFDNILLRDKNAKLNGQITSSNSAVGFYTFGDKVRNARSLGPDRPFETSWIQSGPTKVYKLEDTQIFGSSLYLTGMWSKVSGGFGLVPNGGSGPGVNIVWDTRPGSNIWHGSFLTYLTDRPQKQYRLDGSKFFDAGTMNHELKFGFGYRDTPVNSLTTWSGTTNGYMRLRAASYCTARGVTPTGQCFSTQLSRDKVVAYGEKYNDFYLGDTILLGNLTLQVGARYDIQKSKNLASSAAANPMIGTPTALPCAPSAASFCGSNPTFTTSEPALNFAGDSKEFKWNSIAPRIGLTWALGADKKTLLRAGYNRYVSQMGPTVSASNPLSYTYSYAVGDDVNNDSIVQKSELRKWTGFSYFDPRNPTAITGSTRVDYGANAPYSDELIVGFDRELMTDFVVGVNYSYRKYNDFITTRFEKTQGKGDWYSPADYVLVGKTPTSFPNPPYTVTTPSAPYYDLKAGVDPPTFGVITNRPGYTQKFSGLELLATKRMSNRWMLRGNFSLNDWKEDCSNESFYAGDPTPARFGFGILNCAGGQVAERSGGSGNKGNVYINSKWTFNLTGLYQLPWDFSLGTSLTGRQGYPLPFQILASSVNGDQLADKSIILEPVGDTRMPNVYELDIRAAKDFRFMNRVGLTLTADLFNAPNKRAILQRQTDLTNETGNRIIEMQSPRVWRLGARFNF